MHPNNDRIKEISQLFGSFRAEWLNEQIFDLFTEPIYFPELITTSKPCILEGGRGTGKTTVLRGMSYEGQFAFGKRDPSKIADWSYIGLYYRIDTNSVSAFQGSELSDARWGRHFAHYVNLVLCDLILRFVKWYYDCFPDAPSLSVNSCKKISRSLLFPHSNTLEDLTENLELALIEFEGYVNNVVDGPSPSLSLQGAPIRVLTNAILALPQFQNKTIYFILDEYENLLDYQQRIINTLIKHSGQKFTFKIGVRELGLRRKDTINLYEQLQHPADYSLINITDKLDPDTFRRFAYQVCNERLSKIDNDEKNSIIRDIKALLPSITEEAEAELLGVSKHVNSLSQRLIAAGCTEKEVAELKQITPLQAYLIDFWSTGHKEPIRRTFNHFLNNRPLWDTRYQNYKHSLLYTINSSSNTINKYYAGWDTLTQTSGSNIRFLIEFVYQSLLAHLQQENKIADLNEPVSFAHQTRAAQEVGQRYLTEIEGLANDGAKLKLLLLGLGRIFQVMAALPSGHAPEINQFHLTSSGVENSNENSRKQSEAITSLLTAGVSHLALIRSHGTKISNESGETRDYDYMLHPVFAPFFEFSYRKKRKMQISGEELLRLISTPQQKQTIRDVLKRNNREEDTNFLPGQLLLFETYYRENS